MECAYQIRSHIINTSTVVIIHITAQHESRSILRLNSFLDLFRLVGRWHRHNICVIVELIFYLFLQKMYFSLICYDILHPSPNCPSISICTIQNYIYQYHVRQNWSHLTKYLWFQSLRRRIGILDFSKQITKALESAFSLLILINLIWWISLDRQTCSVNSQSVLLVIHIGHQVWRLIQWGSNVQGVWIKIRTLSCTLKFKIWCVQYRPFCFIEVSIHPYANLNLKL